MEDRVRIYVWFDAKLKTRSGVKPWYEWTMIEEQLKDRELRWFHECYGYMYLYRLWKVDDENFIAEFMHCTCHKESLLWPLYREKPEAALISRSLRESVEES